VLSVPVSRVVMAAAMVAVDRLDKVSIYSVLTETFPRTPLRGVSICSALPAISEVGHTKPMCTET
jgi:hypothetical protein